MGRNPHRPSSRFVVKYLIRYPINEEGNPMDANPKSKIQSMALSEAKGPKYSEYWNPKNETMPREQIEALQLEKLRRLCEYAYATTPFHRQHFEAAGFHPEQLKTLDDIRRIP